MPDFNHIEHIRELIAKHLRNELNENERMELEEWNRLYPSTEQFIEDLRNDDQVLQKIAQWKQVLESKEITREKVRERSVGERRRISFAWVRFAVAASVIVVAGLVIFWIFNKQNTNKKPLPTVANVHKTDDVNPGQYKARLTLSDGSSIVLDTATKGELAKQGGAVVVNKDGRVVYEVERKGNGEVLYNTLATTKGQMYPLTMSDGSHVWLNSASSIRYPVSFTGNERRVSISGEVYFEVAKNAAKPFIVDVNGMQVRVLGTHFNVNAYRDESQIRTTLLEGSVAVTPPGSGKAAILRPGQQAKLGANNELNVTDDADVEKETAWKNGLFMFNGDGIVTVMNELSRWYDIDVVYEGKIPDLQFYGVINRNQPASVVLEMLGEKKTHFRIENKKIIVTR